MRFEIETKQQIIAGLHLYNLSILSLSLSIRNILRQEFNQNWVTKEKTSSRSVNCVRRPSNWQESVWSSTRRVLQIQQINQRNMVPQRQYSLLIRTACRPTLIKLADPRSFRSIRLAELIHLQSTLSICNCPPSPPWAPSKWTIEVNQKPMQKLRETTCWLQFKHWTMSPIHRPLWIHLERTPERFSKEVRCRLILRTGSAGASEQPKNEEFGLSFRFWTAVRPLWFYLSGLLFCLTNLTVVLFS